MLHVYGGLHRNRKPDEPLPNLPASLFSTGTPFTAIIDDDEPQILLDHTFAIAPLPTVLRPDSGNLIQYTIMKHAPSSVKTICVIMRIFNSHGNLSGTVTGNLSLHSNDAVLRGLWEAEERRISHLSADEEIWLQKYWKTKVSELNEADFQIYIRTLF